MTAYQLITLATQIIIVIIAVLTTLDWLEHREHTRLDVMAMFGGLALLVFTQWATSLWGPNPWTGLAGGILLLAHPYLLLRLIPHFRPLPRWVMWLAIGGLAVSAVLFIAITPMLPLLTLAIVLYFVFVEGYAAFAFLRGAQATSGILRARLRLASLGSLLIAGMILLVGIGILVPVLAAILGSVGLLMSISAVVSYYFAFATPHWLRRLWQTSELQSFLYEVAGRWTDAERQETLVRLCRAAMRSMGGTGALVGLWDAESQQFRVGASFGPAKFEGTFTLDGRAIAKAWGTCSAALARKTSEFGLRDGEFARTLEATAMLVAPIATRERSWGLLLAFARQVPLFISDDLATLALLGEQSAVALGYADLIAEQSALIGKLQNTTAKLEETNRDLKSEIEERQGVEATLRRNTQRLEAMNEIDRAILAARSPQEIARVALARVRQLIACQRAAIVLFDWDKNVLEYLAVDELTPLGPPAGTRVPIENYATAWQLRESSRPWSVKDLANDPEPTPIMKDLFEHGMRSMIDTPLYLEGKLIGMMNFFSTAVDGFTTEHLDIAQEVANQLAVTLQQARLREQLAGYAVELEQRVKDRTEQLEASNRELEAFSYSVSHDLRAPLHSMMGFADLLNKEYAMHLDPAGLNYLQLVRDNAAQMSNLINELLAFARSSQAPLQKQPVDPAEMVREVIETLRTERQAPQVDVTIGDLPICEADPGLLRQVWMNLLGNALKFTRERAVAKIEIGFRSENGRCVYYIKDNGAGFDMRNADKLFGVFQRLHHADDYEGTGVGLAIVQRIIHRHGGRIWAEADIDRGATFYFTLE